MGFLFNTDLNNQKVFYDETVTLNIGSPTFSASFTVDHNLGYLPAARVWYEPIAGKWYPLSTRQYNDGADFTFLGPIGEFFITTSQLTVNIRNTGSDPTVQVRIRIYLDD